MTDNGVKLTRLSTVAAERVEWLWPGRLPLGKPVVLDGDPGLGKSTLALNFVATVSTGGRWPTGDTCRHPGDVLLLSGEDGLADTVRPRLDAAGADVERVHAIEGKTLVDPDTGERYLRPLTLADVLDLHDAMKTTDSRLLVVDVLMAFLPTGVDSHRDQDIRRVLSALATAADRNRCTVLLLRHLNKSKGGDPLYRGGGSIGIVGAARAGLLVAPDRNDPDRRVLACMKSNLGSMPESLLYQLVDSPEHGVARVQWLGATDQDARGLLATPDTDEDSDERTAAEHWLQDYLSANGPTASKIIKNAAAKERFSEATLKRAKKSLGVEDRSSGFPRTSTWYLPNQLSTTPSTPNREPTEPTGPDQHKHREPTGANSQSAHRRESEPTGKPKPQCSMCRQTLMAPESLRRGYCEECRLARQQTGGQATVTLLDSRRSGRPTMPAREWFARHYDALRASGVESVDPLDVVRDGSDAGFKEQSVRQAASQHPGVTSIRGRSGAPTIWSLIGETRPTTEQWFADYLDALPDTNGEFDRERYRQAADAAGITWEAARHAALRSGRISTESAHGRARAQVVWRTIPEADTEDVS